MTASPPAAPAQAVCDLPTRWGRFRLLGLADTQGHEHAALAMGDLNRPGPVLTRLHSECLTGDTLGSLRCDCGAQLDAALRAIAQAGRGVLLYLRQEGRGIGLVNKIRAYALQEAGADTVEANRLLGLPDDARDYHMAAEMLGLLGVREVILLTNNPAKLAGLRALGVTVTGREPLLTAAQPHNAPYLATKARRMGHWLPAAHDDDQPAPIDP